MAQGPYRDTVMEFGETKIVDTTGFDAGMFYISADDTDLTADIVLQGRIKPKSSSKETGWVTIATWTQPGQQYVDGLPSEIRVLQEGVADPVDTVGVRLYMNGGSKGKASGGGGIDVDAVQALIDESIIPINHVDAANGNYILPGEDPENEGVPGYFDGNLPLLERQYFGDGDYRWVLTIKSKEDVLQSLFDDFGIAPGGGGSALSEISFCVNSNCEIIKPAARQMFLESTLVSDGTATVQYSVKPIAGAWTAASSDIPTELGAGEMLKIIITGIATPLFAGSIAVTYQEAP